MLDKDFLRKADAHFLQVMINLDTISSFRQRLAAQADQLRRNGAFSLDAHELASLQSALLRVRGLARCCLRIEEGHQSILSWTAAEASRAVQQEHQARHPPPPQLSSDALNATLLREWFIDNIANPVPDKHEKEELVERTNALPDGGVGGREKKPLTYQQVVLWFINMRRRSGWTEFRLIYGRQCIVKFGKVIAALQQQPTKPALGTKDELASLLASYNVPLQSEITDGTTAAEGDDDDDLVSTANKGKRKAAVSKAKHTDVGTGKHKLPPVTRIAAAKDPKGTMRAKECREAYEKMVDFVSAGQKERVGDWLEQVLQEAQKKPRSVKALAAQVEPLSKPVESSSSKAAERKVAKLPTRSSQRQKTIVTPQTPPKAPLKLSNSIPTLSTPAKKAKSSESGSAASSRSPFAPPAIPTWSPTSSSKTKTTTTVTKRKPARLPGTEDGPRLPSTIASQDASLSFDFWQSSQGSEPSQPLSASSLSLTFNIPLHPGGHAVQPRGGSGGSILSSSSTYTSSAYSGSSGSGAGSSQLSSYDSSQTSLVSSSYSSVASSPFPYLLSGIGTDDAAFIRSASSSHASSYASIDEDGEKTHQGQIEAANVLASSEPPAKRGRPGNRPRHTDGGATSSLITSFHQQQQQQMSGPFGLQPTAQLGFQAGPTSPTPLSHLNVQLNLNMLGPFPSPTGYAAPQAQQQAHSLPMMATSISAPAASHPHPAHFAPQGNLAPWYPQLGGTFTMPFEPRFVPMMSSAGPAPGMMGMAMMGVQMGGGGGGHEMRGVSNPERFTEAA